MLLEIGNPTLIFDQGTGGGWFEPYFYRAWTFTNQQDLDDNFFFLSEGPITAQAFNLFFRLLLVSIGLKLNFSF